MLPASNITVRVELRPGEIQFRQNLATTEWIDVGNRSREFLVELASAPMAYWLWNFKRCLLLLQLSIASQLL
jgi:hypothetical protein